MGGDGRMEWWEGERAGSRTREGRRGGERWQEIVEAVYIDTQNN